MRKGLRAVEPEMTAEERRELEEVASEEIYQGAVEKILDETFPRTRWGQRAGSLITAKDGTDYVLYPDGSLRRKDRLEEKIAGRAAT